MDTQAYMAEIEKWRAEMEASLRAEDGWLALAGLFWLGEGENSVGADPDCDVALPAGSAPGRVGTLVRHGAEITLRAEAGSDVRVNGEPFEEHVLRSDAPGPADLVTVGSITLFVIKRGERYGIRVRDRASPARRDFAGRIWYPVRPEYRIEAHFSAFPEPRTVLIPNVLGDAEEHSSPGSVSFLLDGREYTLMPTTSGKRLFFILRDATSSHDTYGVGRFLYADGPENGVVTLDFNRAYNPPCAFTDYATCPMPPKENILDVAIEAGERFAGH